MKFYFLCFTVCLSSVLFAQQFSQNVRGEVIDQFTQTPLPGASIVILGSNPIKGSTSDGNGKFVLNNVSIGRVSVQVSFIGYETIVIPNINVTSAKEVVLLVEMQESINQLDEVTLKASESFQTENQLVALSGRTFSIEETQRFAGARNDVARMSSKLPGVRGTNDAVNDIVIRGNAPSGLLWRMDGMDIPNPNHFGKTGSTGGPVSMLNNNVLRNSDFLTAAFPAQYGNALSGVFDLKMRNGNNLNHEFLGQIGFNGVEFGAEGPISKKNGSSYLINYRYSVLGLMKAMGFNFGTGSAVPEYQDLSFKLNFPLKNQQRISLFGILGNSKIDFVQDPEEIDEEDFYGVGKTNTHSRTKTGVVGVNYFKSFGSNSLLNIQASAGTLIDGDYLDTLDNNYNPSSYYGMDFRNSTYSINVHFSTKLNARQNLRVGVYHTIIHLNMLDSVYNYDYNRFVNVTDVEGETFLSQPYLEWQYRPSDKWKFNVGLHSQYLGQTAQFFIEPRLGINFQLNEVNKLSFGYGLHSQTPAIYLYFRQVTLSDGSTYRPNENLNFTKSHHFVLGYDHNFSSTLRFRIEGYYQQISEAVVEQNKSAFSLLNIGSFDFFVPDSLENRGTGYNYGVDISIEKAMDKGLYYITTLSLYNSRYAGSDNVERYTAWAGDFVLNLVGGKEFVFRQKSTSKSRYSLTADFSVTYAGGLRYTPIDLEQSEITGRSEYNWDEAYTLKYPNYFRTDFRIGFKMQGKKVSHEWALDIQNLTNQQNVQFLQYNPNTNEIEEIYQIGILPIFQYRVEF